MSDTSFYRSVVSFISDLSCVSTRSSPINAKKVNSLNSSDSYIGLWRNYLILCCSSASSSPSMGSSSSTSGSVRCSPPETLASTPDSGYSYDSKVRITSKMVAANDVRRLKDLIYLCISAMTLLFLLIDCWHSVPLLPVQTHCSHDAL